ncbi:hypothetical protein [uncultured Thiodictyon sp.]|uniref:hypothetical protein n=1 Tax=uncultured Thiodictyon sp. TaxID=1846217 RepID=UPI0025DF400C|nr:hypothetical protein [uncultured Thiodictyon sp.]
MKKEDWRALLRWLESASDAELETKILRIEATSEAFREAGPQADARQMISAIRIELDARHAIR